MRPSRILKPNGSPYPLFNWSQDAEPAPAHTFDAEPPQVPMAPTEDALRQAHHRGFVEGQSVVRTKYEELMASVPKELARTVAALSLVRGTIYRDARADLVDLSIMIARRILHRELLVSPDVLQGILTVVLEKLDRQEVHRVVVHPSMVDSVESELKRLAHHRGIKVSGDSTLDTGGCIFETGRGKIDAGIESQLAEIRRGFADHLGS
jgi:flagellar assembly protein FliH